MGVNNVESSIKRNKRKACKVWGKRIENILLKIWELGVIQQSTQLEGTQAKNLKFGRNPVEKY